MGRYPDPSPGGRKEKVFKTGRVGNGSGPTGLRNEPGDCSRTSVIRCEEDVQPRATGIAREDISADLRRRTGEHIEHKMIGVVSVRRINPEGL